MKWFEKVKRETAMLLAVVLVVTLVPANTPAEGMENTSANHQTATPGNGGGTATVSDAEILCICKDSGNACQDDDVNDACPVCSEDYEECRMLADREVENNLGGVIFITGFDELDEEIAWQVFDIGTVTAQNELGLPDALIGYDTNGESFTVTEVTWECTAVLSDPEAEPAFDPEAWGIYEFTAVLSGDYRARQDVEHPVITVIIYAGEPDTLKTPLSDTYQVKVVAWDGSTKDLASCTIEPASPAAGEIVTVNLSTTRPKYAPSGVVFNTSLAGALDIPGHTITRDYDNPSQFTFIMPEQNVYLRVKFAATTTIAKNPYYTPPAGTATPASDGDTIPAVSYTSARALSTTTQALFTSMSGTIDGYLYQFSDGEDYGTIDISGTYLVYTPNADAANKTITICVKAYAGGSVSDEIQFVVKVGAIPEPAKNDDVSLQTLSYQIEDNAPVAINLESNVFSYAIILPIGTEIGKAITLQPILTDGQASIRDLGNAVTDYVTSDAGFTVYAEDPSVTQIYSVTFRVAPPEVAPSVRNGISGLINYNDGDVVLISTRQEIKLVIDHGSGEIGTKACRYSSSDSQIYAASGAFTGGYPATEIILNIRALKLGTTQLTIDFYDTATMEVEALMPVKTITLILATVADYSGVDAAIAQVPNDLTVYTDESVQALNDMLGAVIADKDYTEQSTVDGYAAAIRTAISALKLRLIFTGDAAYDIPVSTAGTAIADIDVSGGVSGGASPYMFTATGLPAGIIISPAGVISGTPAAETAAGSATITVTDNAGDSVSITLAYGAISPVQPDSTTFTITFNANGGAPATQTQTVTAGGTVGTLPVVSRPGYTFIGWNVAQDGDGMAFTTATAVSDSITVFAQWKRNSSGSSANSSGSAGLQGWQLYDDGNWRYYESGGGYVTSSWKQITDLGNTCWYHFGSNGYMTTGWYHDPTGSWYYLNPVSDGSKGAMRTGWLTDPQDGNCYYLDPAVGCMVTGWMMIDGTWYYFNEEGSSRSGWIWDGAVNAWIYEDKGQKPLGMLEADKQR